MPRHVQQEDTWIPAGKLVRELADQMTVILGCSLVDPKAQIAVLLMSVDVEASDQRLPKLGYQIFPGDPT